MLGIIIGQHINDIGSMNMTTAYKHVTNDYERTK